jgi:TonB-linked SusC/RagA family outer membrane protein
MQNFEKAGLHYAAKAFTKALNFENQIPALSTSGNSKQFLANSQPVLPSDLKLSALLKLWLLIVSLAVPLILSAQQPQPLINSTLQGTVINARTKEALIGAAVKIKGTTHAVSTDADGKFAFVTGQKFPYILQVSYLGFESIELTVEGSPVEIQLKETSSKLNEVVIVGYGTQERKNLIGSVTKVNPADTKSIPEGSFDAQLQGKALGVQINTNTGVPGSDVFIRVRGATSINASNDPLYVIDGVFVNNSSLQNIAQERTTSPLADINPSDIESIEILKDASAVAIYGSRGANGVVIVTTKRGGYEKKPKIDFNTSQGAGWVPKERAWKLTTGEEHAILVNEFNKNLGRPLPFRPVTEVINGVPGRGLPSEQKTYDRMAILERTGQLQNYDLSVQGGSRTTRYYVGGGYNSQEATWKPMDFRRGSLKLNLDQKIYNKISIGVSNTVSSVWRNQARPANGGNGTLLQASLNIPTYLPIFDEKGSPLKWVNFDNIDVITREVNLNSKSLRYIGNLYGEIDILKNLKFRTSWSLDFNSYNESEYWGTETLLGAPPTNGRASSSITQATGWVNEQTIRYNQKLGKHAFGIIVGNTLQGNTINNTTARGTNFPNNSFRLISDAANQTSAEFINSNNLASFFSSVDYNFKRKYLLELTLRADGSSRFGKNNRWGYFPAIGGAWKIKDEKFLRDVDFISNLKLRASYGVTGNQNGINDFASLGLWRAGFGYANTTTGGESPGTGPLQLANPDLKWERTSQANIGLDLGPVRDKVNLEFNLYNKYTKDVLLEVAVPSSTGFSSYISNFGEISNKGFELGISSTNFNNGNFTWKTEFNVSRNINNVEKIASPINYATRDVVRIEEGKPLYSYWMYEQLGVNPQTGNIIFRDLNNDGQTTVADRSLVGNTWPKFFGGFNNTFAYKGFDLGVLFTYSYGNDVYNLNRVFGETGGTLDANRVFFKSQLNRWTTPGQVTDIPRLSSENYSIYQNSRFLEDGSFLRLRQLNLGYTIPKKITTRASINTVRFYLTASNLFLFTPYSGADPESNLGVGGQNTQGYDYGVPPQPRTFQFGLNLSL